jgi:hypothetical protein
VRDQLAAGGDALPGNGGAFGVVRGKIRIVEAHAGKFQRDGWSICAGLEFNQRPVEFCPGARRKDFIRHFVGKSDSQGYENNNCYAPFAFECGIKSCHHVKVFYTRQVRLNRNFLRLAMLVAIAMYATGCGGINAGGSVSPAMFLLKNTPPPAMISAPMLASEPSNQFAQAR